MTELARLVARHRDDPSPELSIQWALLRLLDQRGSNALVDDLKASSGPWEAYEARERLWEVLPGEPGVYMFVWRPWFRFHMAEPTTTAPVGKPDSVAQILYIGQAGASDGDSGSTLRERYKSYCKYLRAEPDSLWDRHPPTTRHQLFRYLALRPLEYWFTVIPDRSQIKGLETRLLATFNPPMNKQERPLIRARAAAPRPAFGQ
jgi:hypothetical protein